MKIPTTFLSVFFALSAAAMASDSAPRSDLVSELSRMEFTGRDGQITVTIVVSNVSDENRILSWTQTVVGRSPDGHWETKSRYTARYDDLSTARSRIEAGAAGSAKVIVESAGGKPAFQATVVMDASGAYVHDVQRGKEVTGAESMFGFTFASRSEAEAFKKVWDAYASHLKTE